MDMKGKIALVGSGDIGALAAKIAEQTGKEIFVLKDDLPFEYKKPEPPKVMIANYAPPAKTPKPKHHNRAYPKRKKAGKKTHRKK